MMVVVGAGDGLTGEFSGNMVYWHVACHIYYAGAK